MGDQLRKPSHNAANVAVLLMIMMLWVAWFLIFRSESMDMTLTAALRHPIQCSRSPLGSVTDRLLRPNGASVCSDDFMVIAAQDRVSSVTAAIGRQVRASAPS